MKNLKIILLIILFSIKIMPLGLQVGTICSVAGCSACSGTNALSCTACLPGYYFSATTAASTAIYIECPKGTFSSSSSGHTTTTCPKLQCWMHSMHRHIIQSMLQVLQKLQIHISRKHNMFGMSNRRCHSLR